MYYKRVKEQSTSGGHYHKILFFCLCSGTNTDQNNCLLCVIQSSTSNTLFFNKFLNARENGVFSIGYLIAFLIPDPIEDYMNSVPIIVSNEQSIIMLPINQSLISMHNDLKANESKGFFIQHSRIQVGRIPFLDTKCSGKFCDCQNFLHNSNKSCECFILETSLSNIIFMHSICFSTETGETKLMSKFSYLEFLETFTKGNLSVYIRASRLKPSNDDYDDIVDVFENIVDLVKSKGGWTVYGWGKRGLINYVSILGNDTKESGDNRVLSQ